MKNYLVLLLTAFFILFGILSCQKTISDFDAGSTANTSAHTVAAISGTYQLRALTWAFQGTTINVYDALDVCEKDDLFAFNKDMTLVRTDAGTACSPAQNETVPWTLRNDSIFLGQSTNGAKIKSFDGTTLVLTGEPASDPGVLAVTTYVRK